jgi:AcrR family transcriptional regulator
MEILAEHGLDGLTMQRLADRVDCAVGTVYTYFPSKSALVAAIQRVALQRLDASYAVIRVATDRLLDDDEPSERVRVLARAIGMGRFWAATPETFPWEARLMQGLMAAHDDVIDVDDAVQVLPAAIAHLEHATALLDEAASLGAITAAGSWERVVLWLAAINGVVQTARLAIYDPVLFGGVRLATQLNLDLLRGWGADPDELDRASRHIDRLAAEGPLAPPVADPFEAGS